MKRTSVAFKIKEVMTVTVNYFPKRCKLLLCYNNPNHPNQDLGLLGLLLGRQLGRQGLHYNNPNNCNEDPVFLMYCIRL